MKAVESVEELTGADAVGRPEAFVVSAMPPADELRERLLGFMVHEIRNPLASTLWSAEMLARKPLGDARNDRLAQLASRSVRRLRMLLEDMFALERVPLHPVAGQAHVGTALERALAPRDLEPHGLVAMVEGTTDVMLNHDPTLLDRLFHACLRRVAHLGAATESTTVKVSRREHSLHVDIARTGILPVDVEPPPLTTGGSEGDGTTFAMLLARSIAHRLGAILQVLPSPGGATIRLSFRL